MKSFTNAGRSKKAVPFYIPIPYKIAKIPELFNRLMFTHFSLQDIEGLNGAY